MNTAFFRNVRNLVRGVAALLLLAVLPWPAAAQPVIQPGEVLTYFFAASDDPTSEHGIIDQSGNQHHGTALSFGTEWALVPGHNPATGTFALVCWGDDQADGTGIYTHTPVGALNIDKGPYTCMAWCYRTSRKQGGLTETAGDQAVFGTDNLNPFLLLGFRNSGTEFRHWINGDSGGPGVPLLEWHHVAYRYNPATQSEDIFIDGALVASSGGHGPFGSPNQILLIGRIGRGSAFAGLIEYPRVFRVGLTDDQIAAAAQDKF
jgi:hypothetical protein